MTEEAKSIAEIKRLREQMHYLYIRNNQVSEAVLKTSTTLDKHIYAFMKSTAEEKEINLCNRK